MAEITRDVGDIRPTNFVNPGVRDDSLAMAVEGLGNVGLELDKMLASKRLRTAIQDTTSDYMVKSPAAQQVQGLVAGEDVEEGPSIQLNEDEVKDLNDFEQLKARTLNAVDQGRMNHTQYKLIVDRQLRMAISRRPGLAREFREIAGFESGSEAVNILAAAEDAMNKQGEEGGPDYKRMRDQLDAVGIPAGAFSDAQVLAMYTNNLDGITQTLQAKAREDVTSTLAGTQEAEQKLSSVGATQGFIQRAQTGRLNLWIETNKRMAAVQNMDENQLSQVLMEGRAATQQLISELNMEVAQGNIDPAVRDRELAGIETFSEQLQKIMDGTEPLEIKKRRIESLNAYATHAMLDNESVLYTSNAVKLFGETIMDNFMGPQGQFRKQAFNAVSAIIAGTGSPKLRASGAGDVVSALVQSQLDRKGEPASPEQITAMATTIATAGDAFVIVPDGEYKAEEFTGPAGYVTKLAMHGKALVDSVPAEQREQIAASVAAGAYNHQRVLSANLVRKLPSLRGRVEVRIDPKNGSLIQKKAGESYSAAESEMIRNTNAAFNGKSIINALSTIGELGSADAAVETIYSAQSYVSAARKAAASQPAPAAPAAQASSGGGNWWENF